MLFSPSLLLFGTIFTGAFHTVTGSTTPYSTTGLSNSPFSGNHNNLERRSEAIGKYESLLLSDGSLEKKIKEVVSKYQLNVAELAAAAETILKLPQADIHATTIARVKKQPCPAGTPPAAYHALGTVNQVILDVLNEGWRLPHPLQVL
ncbi:hypothetical protein BC835DRAFT_1368307 [Cytidiella melzeri]|nr:hypothetical protein BC835DRAFT_1368307 [Cytidiella melzeri]